MMSLSFLFYQFSIFEFANEWCTISSMCSWRGQRSCAHTRVSPRTTTTTPIGPAHYHSDHTTGLYASFDRGMVYCSEITAALLIHDMGISPQVRACLHHTMNCMCLDISRS